MKCKNHTFRNAIGYCQMCGTFYCEECLKRASDGKSYCPTCLVSKGLTASGSAEPHKPASDIKIHLKLIAKYKTGKTSAGTAYKLDLAEDGFYMLRIGGRHHGRREFIQFKELKGIYHVKEFGGPLTIPSGVSSKANTISSGKRVTINFPDGEFIEGYVHSRYTSESKRFNLIPLNADGNVISIMIERSAVNRVDVGGSANKLYLQELMDTDLKKKLLKQYWNNPSARVLTRHLAGMLDTNMDALQEALKPYMQMKLAQAGTSANDPFIAFSPPPDRTIRDFIIRQYRRLTPAAQRGR